MRVYDTFPLLQQSEKDGFVFGAITRPWRNPPSIWGDAYVVAPNGSRAGIVWVVGNEAPKVLIEPEEGRWGVYQFSFPAPMSTEQELIENLQSILPALKDYYARAGTICPESTV